MPVMAIYRSREMDRATFDRLRREVPIEPIPDGAISHHIAFDKDGLIGIDVWQSQAHLEAFARDRLNPGLARLGLHIQPPEVLELHELVIAPQADRQGLAPAAS